MKAMIRPAVSLFVVLTVVTGVVYPLAVTGFAKLAFPQQAAGSMIVKEIKEGMVFAIETFCPSADGFSGARIEEEVVVTDKGCKVISLFPAEELPRLFQSFRRGANTRNTPGTGLGLAVCRRLAEAMGGSVAARASALGGLAVDIDLPIATDGSAA